MAHSKLVVLEDIKLDADDRKMFNIGSHHLAEETKANFVDLIEQILNIEPEERLTSEQILEHKFFSQCTKDTTTESTECYKIK